MKNIIYLLKLIIDHFWFLVSLEPHHILGVKPPTLLLQCLRRQILGLGALHVIENEEESLRRKSLEEVDGITALGGCLQHYYVNILSETKLSGLTYLGIVGRSVTRVPGQVGPQSLRVRRMGQMV